MATGVRVAITLACTECKRRNYQTEKSKRNSPDRVEFRSTAAGAAPHAAPGDALAMARQTRSRAPRPPRGARPQSQEAPRARSRAAPGARRPSSPPPTQDGAAARRARGRRPASVSFIGESWAELKKVEWPSQQQLIQGTVVVLIACVVVGVYLFLADEVFRRLRPARPPRRSKDAHVPLVRHQHLLRATRTRSRPTSSTGSTR